MNADERGWAPTQQHGLPVFIETGTSPSAAGAYPPLFVRPCAPSGEALNHPLKSDSQENRS
jgi:hypothetical protein